MVVLRDASKNTSNGVDLEWNFARNCVLNSFENI